MVNLVCLRCGNFFKHGGSFRRHLSSLVPCPPNLSNQTLEEVAIHYGYSEGKNIDKINKMEVVLEKKEKKVNLNQDFLKGNGELNTIKVQNKDNKNRKYQCPYCYQFYTRKNNMIVHIKKYCKSIPNETVINKDELDNIKKSLEEIKSKPNVVNYNNNLQINNIQLNKYGDENQVKISEEVLKKVIRNPMKGIPDLIGMHHFNPEYPENHNVRYCGKKFYVDVYNGNFWEAKDKGEVIHNMIVSKKDIADDYFDESVEQNKLEEKTKEKYNSFSERVDRYVNAILNELNYEGDLIKEDREVYNQLCKQVELMMMNAQRILSLKDKNAPSPFAEIKDLKE